MKVRKAIGRRVDGGSKIGKIEVLGGGAFPLGILNGRAGVPNAGDDEGIGSPVAILKRSGCRGVEASILSQDFKKRDKSLIELELTQKLQRKSSESTKGFGNDSEYMHNKRGDGVKERGRETEIQNSIKSKTRDTRAGAKASSFNLLPLFFSHHSALLLESYSYFFERLFFSSYQFVSFFFHYSSHKSHSP